VPSQARQKEGAAGAGVAAEEVGVLEGHVHLAGANAEVVDARGLWLLARGVVAECGEFEGLRLVGVPMVECHRCAGAQAWAVEDGDAASFAARWNASMSSRPNTNASTPCGPVWMHESKKGECVAAAQAQTRVVDEWEGFRA
jgi:hypothetical protein